ncbi:MAG TPA: lamin tail domain-containing protein, partial [Rhodothermales bacterium]|nr:lamin tail domain-containing protein [Rhodothermales bacterium]
MRAFSLLLLLASLVGLSLPAQAQQRGDVIITEVLANPGGTITDASGEWFELFNNSNRPRNLQNWMVRDSAASGVRPRHLISSSVVMPPYGFVVLGNTTNTTINGGAAVQYAYGAALALANSLDRVIVERPDPTLIGVEVAHANYQDPAITPVNGVSRERSSILFDTALPYRRDSLDSSFWLSALVTDVYGPGGRGTPGAAGQTNTFGLGPSVATLTTSGAGYRLLSPPVGQLDVDDLASMNLVQGISDEFPTFGANLFTHYSGNPATGAGGFVAPAAKAD